MLFLVGVNYGFSNVGTYLGTQIASKEYNWFGSNEEFSKLSRKIMITSIITIIIGLVVTILSTAHYHFYTTFSLFDNICSAPKAA